MQLKSPTKWLCPAPPWPEQTLGKSCQHVFFMFFLTKIIEPFCRAPTPNKKISITRAGPLSIFFWWSPTLLLQNGFSNLYKMGRHNPCTTKNSPYKMALGQMNPSKNGRPYKMVGARGISQTPKINKKLGL